MVGSRATGSAPSPVDEEKGPAEHVLRTAGTAPQTPESPSGWRAWFQRDVIAFFILGNTMALPTTILFTAAHSMFPMFTGAFILALSLSAVATLPPLPYLLPRTPYPLRILLIFIGTCLSFFFPTLGHHIPPGQISGTSMAATVYAFATAALLDCTPHFSPLTATAFTTGSGASVLTGPPLFIAITRAFLPSDWKTPILLCMATAPLLPLTWFVLVPAPGRRAAEAARRKSRAHSSSTPPRSGGGFGPERTRVGLFFKVLLPRYIAPLATTTAIAMIALLGLSPSFGWLRVWRNAPGPADGDLGWMCLYVAYAIAQFAASFAASSARRPFRHVWALAALSAALLAVGIAQLFVAPLLTYYGVWVAFVFVQGGCVGAAVVATNWRIAEDFAEEAEEVRSFAMTWGGLGNVVGDVVGGAFAIMVQRLAVEGLEVRGVPMVRPA